MEKILNYLIFILLLFLGFISKIVSKSLRTRYGCIIGDFMRLISHRRREITLSNIQYAFPEMSAYNRTKVMKESYRNLGITMSELLAFPIITKSEILNEYIKFENFELIHEVLSRGKGVILLSGHFGNWEIMAFACGKKLNKSVLIPVKPQKNQFVDKILNKYRTLGGNEIVPMDQAARKIFITLKKDGIVAMLADQSATADKDVFVDFFGRQAATYEAPAELALKLETPILLGFSIRQDDGSYLVHIEELDFSDLKYDKENIIENKNKVKILTERHVKILEREIRLHPGLWSWQHRRWKHTHQE